MDEHRHTRQRSTQGSSSPGYGSTMSSTLGRPPTTGEPRRTRLHSLGISLLCGLVACSVGVSTYGTAAHGSTPPPPTPTDSTAAVRPEPVELAGSQLGGDVAFLGPILTVPISDITMAYRQFGAGPDLLLINGQAASMSVWPASLLRWLAQTHRVTIYDNRGLGNTVAANLDFTLPDLADDAAALIETIGLDRPDVFGWSTGGEIGLLLAARHPDTISTLAITGATPGGPHSVLPPPEMIELFASPTPDPGAILDMLFSPDGAEAQAAVIADISKVTQIPVTAETAQAYDEAEHAYWAAPEPDWETITIPTLVMNGQDDVAVPPANAEYIAEQLGTNAQLELDPRGRHAWFLEHPDHFKAVYAPFIN